jgi:hypothetical protein
MKRKRFPRAKTNELTHDIIERVAGVMTRLGMPLRYALALEHKGLTNAWFEDQLEKAPELRLLFDEKIATGLVPVLEEIKASTLRTMPASVWLLERRFAADFAQPKAQAGGGVQVNVQVNGLSGESFERAARLVASKKVKQLPAPAPVVTISEPVTDSAKTPHV